MTLALHYALRSDVGLLREGNEDSAYAGPRLLAIADGMGGHAAGEVASAVAIAAISPLDRQGLTSSEDMLDGLASAVASARETLHEMSESAPAVEGMGTTLTAMLWSGASVAVCHIGDSRAYLLRNGELWQITRDHTLIQSLVDEGRISPAAAANHPQRSLIIRALQGSTEADPDLGMHTAELGDRYLLCSDGLTDVVEDQDVHGVLTMVTDADEAVGRLIAMAIRNGGPDNITCIVADVVDEAGPVAPTTRTQLAGAAANGDARTLLRAATGNAAAAAPESGTSAILNGHGASADTAGVRAGDSGPAAAADDEPGPGRRRWPLVSTILVVLVAVIAGGLYFGYRATQGQYYLARDGSQIEIYRGLNEKIAFVSLSRRYRPTGVPVSHLPGDLSLPTQPASLASTQATLTTIKHMYACKQAATALGNYHSALQKWNTRYGHRPKPTGGRKLPPAPPKPAPPAAAPAYCGAQGAG